VVLKIHNAEHVHTERLHHLDQQLLVLHRLVLLRLGQRRPVLRLVVVLVQQPDHR